MANAEFVHLHNHSEFSLLRASTRIPDLVSRTRELGMKAVALTDDGNLFGALRFYLSCTAGDSPITPIIGCDFYMALESRHNRAATEGANRYHRLVLLATSDRGYRNLMELSSAGYTEGFYYRPRIDKELVALFKDDLVALSGGMGGEIPQLISRNRLNEAREVAAWYRDTFGPDRFYLELTDHGIPDQRVINKGLIELSRELNIPLVATNDTYYLRPEDANSHDILLCIGNKRKKAESSRFKFSSNEFWLKSPEQMLRIFSEVPEACANTLKIAEMCNFKMELPGPQLPDFQVPPSFKGPDDYLRHISKQGLEERYARVLGKSPEELDLRTLPLNEPAPVDPKVLNDRLEYELDIIINMGFSGYFLIVWDFIRFAHDNGIPVGPGRGSGAGSLVAYALRITDLDPLRYGLLFERFLNPDRISLPDFDIDFCYERRQEVIDYVTEHYGQEKVGQIITFGTLKAKAVIRDVARVLDLPFNEADRIAKLVPKDLGMTLPKALEIEPQLREMADSGGVFGELIDTSMRIEKLSRHASTHAAGVVIGRKKLTEYVPLFRDPRTGAVSTQYTMDLLETCGLVKMDILGLKTLTLITHTLDLIHAGQAPGEEPFDIDKIPEGDPATYKLFGEGRSTAVFQFESPGMRQTLKKAKPSRIEDLIALNALYRPGPLDNIPQFVESKLGKIPIRYPHQSLEPVLKETYGVIVYQEQVMEIVRLIAGFSLGEADILRRAMGKKKLKELEELFGRYMEGARKQGIDPGKAEEIFELLKPFANYGFNKSHAAAYSILAYKTAYLKANYPAEFMAANLTNEINSPDKFAEYLAETREMGIEVLPPDINTSERRFTVSNGKIVYGLLGIKGIGTSVVDEILRARQEAAKANGGRHAGPVFTHIEQFLSLVDLRVVNRKAVEILAACGAFRSLHGVRRAIIQNLDLIYDRASSKKTSRAFGQESLFGDDSPEEFPPLELAGIEEFPMEEILATEREFLGNYFSGHPMDRYREIWQSVSDLNTSRMPAPSGSDGPKKQYAVVAMVTQFRSLFTKKGSRMGFGKIEDFRGTIDFVLFPDAFETHGGIIEVDKILGFIGSVEQGREELQLVVSEVRLPEDMDPREGGELHIRLRPGFSEDDLRELRSFLHDNSGPSEVYLHIPDPEAGADDGTSPESSASGAGTTQVESIVRAATNLRVSTLGGVLDRLRLQPAILGVWKEYPEPEIAEAAAPEAGDVETDWSHIVQSAPAVFWSDDDTDEVQEEVYEAEV